MSLGAYLLLRFSDSKQLLPAITRLKTCPQVQRWDAMEGHAHLVVRTSSPVSSPPEEIRQLAGLRDLVAHEILSGPTPPGFKASLCHAYVFIETEPTKTPVIKSLLDGMPEVHSCVTVRGGCDLVVVVQGETFKSITTTVHQKISHLDGVLRLKMGRVIDLKQL